MLRCGHACGLAGKQLCAWGSHRSFSALTIDFGKHRGLTFEECRIRHPDYCEWLLKQPDNARTAEFRSYLSQPAKPPQRPAPPPPPPPPPARAAGGSQEHVIRFGKHKGKSFAEVCLTDAQYCQWAVQSAQTEGASESIKLFAAFVEDKFSEVLTRSASSPMAMERPAVSRAPEVTPQKSQSEPARTSFQGKKNWSSQRDGADGRASWKTQGKASVPADDHTVLSGNRVIGGGKFADMTYAEVFNSKPDYCRFVVEFGLSDTKKAGWYWPFIVYVQNRWLTDGPDGMQPPANIQVTSSKNCLKGARFVISGRPVEMPRHALEKMIAFFGGTVTTAVSSKTTYLVVGGAHLGGQPVEAGAKYAAALKHDIPRVTVAELLEDLRATQTNEDGDQVTFTSGVHAQGAEHESVE